MPSPDALNIGVSQCLLGSEVRYNGAHKASGFLLGLLAPHFNLVPVCPEVEMGMGVPREPVRLVGSVDELRMIGTESGTDHTAAMTEFSIKRVEELEEAQLAGYIFKSGSPSCGLDVEVQSKGEPARSKGMFAEAVVQAFPDIPVIEENLLGNSAAREGFVERVHAFGRLAQFFSKERSVGQLAMAHAQAKFQLDAHNPDVHAEIQKLFGDALAMPYRELCDRYRTQFMEALEEPATIIGHFEVLKRIFTDVKGGLEPGEVKELARALQDYRLGTVPLSVPITLLRHYVRIQDNVMLNGQTYLDPGPRELILRTQI